MTFKEIKYKTIQEAGRDPLSDPYSWDLIEKYLDRSLWPQLYSRSGAAVLAFRLPEIFNPSKIIKNQEISVCWERIGNLFKNQGRFHEALSIYFALYYQLLEVQKKTGKFISKGTPLVWISECYFSMKFPVHTKRYLMLTLFEDAIQTKGNIPPESTGVYSFSNIKTDHLK